MCSENSNVKLLLEYKLLNLKKKASQIEELKEDIQVLEDALQDYNDEKVHSLSHGDCSLELTGYIFKKKLGKYELVQMISDLEKKNTYLKQKLKHICKTAHERDAVVAEYKDTCEEISSLFQNIDEDEDIPLKDNLKVLQTRIYNLIVFTADIKKQFWEKDDEINSLKKKIDQYSSILSCIQRKRGAQENLVQESQLYQAQASVEMENKNLSDTISDLNKIYNHLSSQIEGLKNFNVPVLNEIVQKLCDKQFKHPTEAPHQHVYLEWSASISRKPSKSRSLIIENEKDRIKLLKLTKFSTEANAKRIKSIKRRIREVT